MLYTPLYDCCLFRNSYTNRAVNSGIQPKRSTSPPFFIFSEPAFIPGLNRFIKTVQSPARKAAAPTLCSFVYIFLFVSFFLCKRKKSRFRRICFTGAEDEIRTRDPRLGKAMLYHWATSAYKIRMPRAGIEPATRGFSVLCSTDWAIEA